MHKQRLGRLHTVFARYPIYFVTLCTANRRAILGSTPIHASLTGYFSKAAEFGAFVGEYVIMPDHIHLFVEMASGGPSLSDWVKSLKNTLSRTLRLQGCQPPHWQKGFFDHVLRSTDSYDQKWRYVAENPTRAGLVESAAAWPFQGIVHDLRMTGHRRS